ncbi:MAG TPA: hypothetical protein VN676_18245 [Steroidobacteraceae bacterium]|nr:hypothetical protein [Steroidobacteraceae bacterium]
MTRPVFLVGSVPFTDTEEVFRCCATALGKYATRLPDGERGGWLPGDDFRRTRGLIDGRGQSLLNPPISQTVRLSEGTSAQDLAFETLHYLPNAKASYAVFSRLKQAGLIAADTRYQVSIPSAFTGCIHFDHDQVRELWPAYEAALFREVQRIMAAIPADELAISWDVVDFGISLANPDPIDEYGFDELAAAMARAIDVVSPGVECGLHFCYGGHNSNGMLRPGLNRREITDTELMTQFFNAIRARASRPINWLHVPVPRPRAEAEYFKPLSKLQRGPETQLYLGLLHVDDGIELTRHKVRVAEGCVGPVGVAAACGLNPFVSGIPATRLPEVIDYHRRVAEAE